MTCRPGIVVDQWYDNTGVTSLVFDILHVGRVGEVNTTARTAVLILRLIKDDRAAICDLTFGNSSSNIGNVANQKLATFETMPIVSHILIGSL